MDASYSTSIASTSSIDAERCSTPADDESLSMSDVTDDVTASPHPVIVPPKTPSNPPQLSSPGRSNSPIDIMSTPAYGRRGNATTDDDVKPSRFYFLQDSPPARHHPLDVATLLRSSSIKTFYNHRYAYCL